MSRLDVSRTSNIDTSIGTHYASWALIISFLAFAAAIGIESTIILIQNNGNFSYSLDDPYIHLALAENLLHGHYGINPEEVSSPSSSIVYPYLLSGTLLLKLGQFGPLMLNVLAGLGVIWVLMDILRRDLRLVSVVGEGGVLAIVLLLAFAINLVGVTLTGMEHTLHILTSLLVLKGLFRTLETDRVPAWLVASLIACPLIRFEGLGITSGALLALVWLGHWRVAVATGLMVAITVGGFMAWLMSMGLEPLPSSVLIKSTPVAKSIIDKTIFGTINSIAMRVGRSLTTAGGLFSVLMLFLLLLKPFMNEPLNRNNRLLPIAYMPAFAIVAHMIAGLYGYSSRYELYVVFVGVVALIFLWRNELIQTMCRNRLVFMLAVGSFLGITTQYWISTLLSPLSSASIYLQQYQMHRFVTDYLHQPVAVNDLGWVAYDNDNYVLDLYGLGSEQARIMRTRSQETIDVNWMGALADAKGVHVVMIYSGWFNGILPPTWEPLGNLTITSRIMKMAAAISEPTVTFYATPLADKEAVSQALSNFSNTLPSGVKFVAKD